jgi:hypothetical protein
MAAEYILKTGDWDRMEELLAPLARTRSSVAGSSTRLATPGCAGHVAASAERAGLEATAWVSFVHGEAAAARKDARSVARNEGELEAVVQQMTSAAEKQAVEDWRVRVLELQAQRAEIERRVGIAIASLRQAISIEESGPPSGPATDVLARERLGELLLRQNRAIDALHEFRIVLVVRPRRARSLLGAARAATVARDPASRDYYAELAKVWAHADKDEPALPEVARVTSAAQTGR